MVMISKPKYLRANTTNLRTMLTDELHPIRKLRVLALTASPASSLHDAQNSCRIYARMLAARAVCPRVILLLSRLAKLLLYYSEAHELYPISLVMVRKRITLEQGSAWIVQLLDEISNATIETIYGRSVVSFRLIESRAAEWESGTCPIFHIPVKNPTRQLDILKEFMRI